MEEYTFCSMEPGKYNEIFCPINFIGTSQQIKWYANNLTGNCNIIILSKDDYFTIEYNDVDTLTIHPTEDIFDVDDTTFRDYLKEQLTPIDVGFSIDTANRWTFDSGSLFTLKDCSYHFKQVMGFYYTQFPIDAVQEGDNWYIKGKASGYKMGTSMWYAMCNMGSSCVSNHPHNPYNQFYTYVCMRIFNSFQQSSPFSWSNSDFVSTCQASALSNIQIKIVDENFEPIRFTNPVWIYITVEQIEPPEEDPFAEQPEDKAGKKQREQQLMDKRMALQNSIIQQGNYNPAAERVNEDAPHPLQERADEERAVQANLKEFAHRYFNSLPEQERQKFKDKIMEIQEWQQDQQPIKEPTNILEKIINEEQPEIPKEDIVHKEPPNIEKVVNKQITEPPNDV
jgi:hypothetical protein